MNRAESILSEVLQSLEGTVDEMDVQYVMKKAQGPAFVSEQEAHGADRADRAVALMVEEIKKKLPPFMLIQQGIFRICTSPDSPLRMKEEMSFHRELQGVINPDSFAFKYVREQNGAVSDVLKLSLVYWVNHEA